MDTNPSDLKKIKESREWLDKTFWRSNLNFTKQFNGFRPQCIHTILSNTGGGKSTLARSLIHDALTQNPEKKVLVWLTEETKIFWEGEFFRILDPKEFENRLFIFSEKDFLKNRGRVPADELFRFILSQIMAKGIDLLILDNITTSNYYEIKDYDLIAKSFQMIMPENLAMVIFSHTNKTYSKFGKTFMDPDNIFGSTYLSKISEFFLCLYTINTSDRVYSAISIEKNRHYPTNDRYFALNFDKKYRMFLSDEILPFENFKNVWKNKESL